MQELSRISLYRWTSSFLQDNTELLAQILVDNSVVEDIIHLLNFNIIVLEEVEHLFFTDTKEELNVNDSGEKLIGLINQNINNLRDNKYFESEEFNKLLEKIAVQKIYYAFNSLINFLNEKSNKIIFDLGIKINSEGLDVDRKQVFLSHAFEDKLYTYALFLYMYDKDINLYVDWLYNEEIKDGILLKRHLKNELNKSSQLLYLRSINSELRIRGSGSIRPWCSWELGSYYSIYDINKKNKFYIEMYDRPDYKGVDNLQLDGIKPLKSIAGGTLL